MRIVETNSMLDGILTTTITVRNTGVEGIQTKEDELKMLNAFAYGIDLQNLEYKTYIKMVDNLPTITTEDDPEGESLGFSYHAVITEILDEDFKVSLSIDTLHDNLPTDDIFTTKDTMAQAYLTIFSYTVRKAITEALTYMRNNFPNFLGVTLYENI